MYLPGTVLDTVYSHNYIKETEGREGCPLEEMFELMIER